MYCQQLTAARRLAYRVAIWQAAKGLEAARLGLERAVPQIERKI
jgi:hypothetical protein